MPIFLSVSDSIIRYLTEVGNTSQQTRTHVMKAALQNKREITSSTSSDPRMKASVLLAEMKTTTCKSTITAPHILQEEHSLLTDQQKVL